MQVLITGAHGQVGDGLKRYLGDRGDYELTYLDRDDHPDYDTHVADVNDYDAIRPAFDGQDAVIHLAAYPTTDGTWEQIRDSNLHGTHNVLEAAADAGVSQFVFASSIHAAGMYEEEHAPELYELDFDLTVTHEDPERPDSYYGASKAFGEDWGRYFIECREYPEQFYAIRIASIREPPYDNPYGDAEKGVERGDWERGSHEYETQVKRLQGTWLSQRDWVQLVELCLADDELEFGIFFATSENERGWYDITHAKDVLGYEPQDQGEAWTEPPQDLVEHVENNREI
ncbi:NAD+ dependent glucose-6-phosphate dehydrogenase [Halalkaliarchaeum desulfuricum]|uniref:NAD+ dependent glucose-6-phosphate dehydrogenase n=1 Tax=Halalkaliarchaeum desulfuricum TaxID=2055893 RepID=A0A343TG47_9EURY|nr:NAD(P)-dependent oxidoreductase [Halalkaliarchaeum desulfuricum]AUX08069.1 NAD+ dependent glucose-6-phosphate dehydrogenase [Halalkaliarchaeum desulfuricum]